MKTNKYPGACAECGGHVAKNAGTLTRDAIGRWKPLHLECAKEGAPAVDTYSFAGSGKSITRNRKGICEDAPCCGCCTF